MNMQKYLVKPNNFSPFDIPPPAITETQTVKTSYILYEVNTVYICRDGYISANEVTYFTH